MTKEAHEKQELLSEIVALEVKLRLPIMKTCIIESNTIEMLKALRDKRMSELEELNEESIE